MSSAGGNAPDRDDHITPAFEALSINDPTQDSTAADAAPQPSGFAQSHHFQQRGWPKGFYATKPEDAERAAREYLRMRDGYLKSLGAKFASFTSVDEEGNIEVRAQQLPGPSNTSADRTRVKILVERNRPTHPPYDRDSRTLARTNDTFTRTAPYEDTIKIFPREIELSRTGDNMAWVPGQMLGEKDENAKAPISYSNTFVAPGARTDCRSSTSRGHHIVHPRETGSGAGWGGHDKYYEWQANGRSIDKSWPQDRNWDDFTQPLKFVGENGTVQEVHYSPDEVEKIHNKTAKFKTLREKFDMSRGRRWLLVNSIGICQSPFPVMCTPERVALRQTFPRQGTRQFLLFVASAALFLVCSRRLSLHHKSTGRASGCADKIQRALSTLAQSQQQLEFRNVKATNAMSDRLIQ
ncbi:hypothetical protein NM208_g3020 [Fusarium decemcellulare]|uniref:Uncharacterized protein n=1 Tax=Fusarium decemcellulare TaxID=57161 RepID=A0ACC1SQF7_9HYPO|nr:hypothetical protein NM208_g3020 [Fusarium decemcellulare]